MKSRPHDRIATKFAADTIVSAITEVFGDNDVRKKLVNELAEVFEEAEMILEHNAELNGKDTRANATRSSLLQDLQTALSEI